MPENIDEILGLTSSSAGASPQAGAPYHPRPAAVNSAYYGWGGWLALFCIVQVFVQPIIVIVSCVADASAYGYSSSLDGFLTLEIAGMLGVCIFGIITGIQLWRLSPGAVRVAKAYLVTALVWSVLKAILAFAVLEGRYQDAVGAEEVKGVFVTLIPFVIWFSYFNVSKRIKVTFYGEDETIHIVPPSV